MDPLEVALEAFQRYVAQSAVRDRPADSQAALDAARQAVADLGASGALPVQQILDDWAELYARRARLKLHDQARKLVRRVAAGEMPLGDLNNAIVVPIGEGGETLFGLYTAQTLPLADRERYGNVQDAVRQYDIWREGIYDPGLPVLIGSGLTWTEAYQAGLFWRP